MYSCILKRLPHSIPRVRNKRRGVTLLLVVIILTSIFAISLGIFEVFLGQVIISGQLESSFIALYGADQGIERTLYRDRDPNIGPLANGATETRDVESGGCYLVSVTKTSITQIDSRGQNTPSCPIVTARTTVRALRTGY
ncbi:MAG: hypothetical protein HY006_01965 [Candidatus Sungbacteria bacterium]|nr:hypothetical protein [Candidatus Sungbacteria bacterium]